MAFDRKIYNRSNKKKEIDKAYYENNKEQSMSRTRKYRKVYKEWFETYKNSLVCEKCGFTGHCAAIDFHHDNGDKLFNVAKLAGQTSNKNRIEKEIKKCKVLCSNCHRILHWNLNRDSAIA